MAVPSAVPQLEAMSPIGATSNTDYYMLAPHIIVAAPRVGMVDDGASAQENVDFQQGYARDFGHPCGVIVLIGSLSSQDADARRVYAEKMDPALIYATALVVNSPLARAMGSFFLGLTKPRLGLGLFPDIDACVSWLEARRPTEPRV